MVFLFAGVYTAPAQDEPEVVPNTRANFSSSGTAPQDEQEMNSVQPQAQNEQDRSHASTALHIPSDEGSTPPLSDPEHGVEYRESNQSANHFAVAEVTQDEQRMDNHLPMEAVESGNVPCTGEGDVQPQQDDQGRTATPPDETHTPPPANTREATTNNQLGDRVGDGSAQSHAPNSDRPTLDKEQHFVLRRGSQSFHNDPDVRRESKPTIPPLVRVVADSSQSPRSPTKKRRISIPSFPSKRQSQVGNDEETKLLELPKTPKTSSHTSRRQSKSENDEEKELLKEQSPVDEEHPTIGDEHTSDNL